MFSNHGIRTDGKFLPCTFQGLFRQVFLHVSNLKSSFPWSNFRRPILHIPFSFPHSNLSRLFRHRNIWKHLSSHFTRSISMMSSGSSSRLQLPGTDSSQLSRTKSIFPLSQGGEFSRWNRIRSFPYPFKSLSKFTSFWYSQHRLLLSFLHFPPGTSRHRTFRMYRTVPYGAVWSRMEPYGTYPLP